jgi:uncharacterized protein
MQCQYGNLLIVIIASGRSLIASSRSASTAFYVALGGEVNAEFSDEQATSVMFSDAIGVMLLTHDRYRQFTQRPIGDARRDSQMLLTLSVDQRDAVDATLTRAVAAGGSPPRK